MNTRRNLTALAMITALTVVPATAALAHDADTALLVTVSGPDRSATSVDGYDAADDSRHIVRAVSHATRALHRAQHSQSAADARVAAAQRQVASTPAPPAPPDGRRLDDDALGPAIDAWTNAGGACRQTGVAVGHPVLIEELEDGHLVEVACTPVNGQPSFDLGFFSTAHTFRPPVFAFDPGSYEFVSSEQFVGRRTAIIGPFTIEASFGDDESCVDTTLSYDYLGDGQYEPTEGRWQTCTPGAMAMQTEF